MHDFDLHAPEGANKKKRIIGRGQGSGRGTTAGKGNKGQKARSGGKTYIGFEGGQMPLYRRIAQRGFSNYPFKKTYQVVNLDDIAGRFEEGEKVDAVSLIKKGLVKGSLNPDGTVKRLSAPVKVLGGGEPGKKLILSVGSLSASAREKIEKAGGTVEALPEGETAAKKKGGAKKKAAARKDGE
ncbi:MAG: 50S ribosomal protein L15 [Treponema sp.]|jgi:large subunit ribosomal protein L15|nr:50S ribosomal protein L15 [Treponema sp.]